MSRHNLGLDSGFDDVRVFARDPQLEVVGTKGMAECFVDIQRSWVMARVYAVARSIGAAQSVMNCAIGYTKDREQLWQSSGNFRFFRFKVPTALSETEYARRLVYCVRNEIDHGRRCDKKGAVVNYFSTEMSEKSYLTKIFEGTSEMMKRIISDRMMGKQDRTYGEMGIPTSCKNVLIGVSSKCSTQPSASGNIRSPEI